MELPLCRTGKQKCVCVCVEVGGLKFSRSFARRIHLCADSIEYMASEPRLSPVGKDMISGQGKLAFDWRCKVYEFAKEEKAG